MSTALRESIAAIQDKPEHAGLWLDRFCPELAEPEKVKPRLFDAACATSEPPLYKFHYEAWRKALEELGARLAEGLVGARVGPTELPGRLVVGLGGESVLETSVTLHRTYGVPFIPGSALKGLAASYAHRRLEDASWREDGRAHKAAFGTTENAGCVVFHDALYVPGSGFGKRALHQDVMTVHHPDYYQKGESAPADWDNPIPVHFLTSTGKYLLAVSGPSLWTEKVLEILALALAEEGVGGKTSRGYGRMAVTVLPWAGASPAVSAPAVQEFQSVERLKAVRPGDVRGQIGQFTQQWKNLAEGAEKKALGAAILARVDEINWNDGKGKPWYQEIQAYLAG